VRLATDLGQPVNAATLDVAAYDPRHHNLRRETRDAALQRDLGRTPGTILVDEIDQAASEEWGRRAWCGR